jgi:chemotaxis protein methyltransferase CheR
MIDTGSAVEVPAEALSNPALLFLYYRIDQILGIRAAGEALIKLNEYIEKSCGASFVENPSVFNNLLSNREQIYEISKFLTVNETYFFREGVHFELLARFLPELAKLNRPIQICSAASSIGCEAYSIAMLLDYHAKKGGGFDFEIDAFDINGEAIETARNARYPENALRGDGSAWKYIMDSYLIRENGEFTVTQNIREKVRFFTHNIMNSLDRRYDVVFFRNALIYFSSQNRLTVLDNLAETLFNNGFLFLGVSETASVNHPLLKELHSSDAFYFQKISNAVNYDPPDYKKNAHRTPEKIVHNLTAQKGTYVSEKTVQPKREELQITGGEIAAILETEEGKPNAKKNLDALANETAGILSGGELAACVLYFLNIQDFNSAEIVLSRLEERSTGAFTRFLRGEYFFLAGSVKEAEHFYNEAAVRDREFWPAFYRIASLSEEGNRTRYEYKIKKAIESIEMGRELKYECFMGGFSPDYFLKILEKKLTKTKDESLEYNIGR